MNCLIFITANTYFQSGTIVLRLHSKARDGHNKHYAPKEIIKRQSPWLDLWGADCTRRSRILSMSLNTCWSSDSLFTIADRRRRKTEQSVRQPMRIHIGVVRLFLKRVHDVECERTKTIWQSELRTNRCNDAYRCCRADGWWRRCLMIIW